MNILVIGGAGYIGRHVVQELLDNNYNVIVFDNFSTGLRDPFDPKVKVIEGDMTNYMDLKSVFNKYVLDSVILMAASKDPEESEHNMSLYSIQNIIGPINVINCMMEFNVKSLVFSSSAAVYGDATNPFGLLNEDSDKHTQNYYGFTKYLFEQILEEYRKRGNINYVALRYFNASGYDPQGRVTSIDKECTNVIPKLMKAIINEEEFTIYGNDWDTIDGTPLRDYIHVTDLADAHVKSINYISKENKSLVANLGTGTGYTVLELVNMCNEVLPKKVKWKYGPRRDGDGAYSVANPFLANHILKWYPKYSDIRTIIETTWKIYE